MGNSNSKILIGLVVILVACESQTPVYNYPVKFGHEYPIDDEFNIATKYGVEPQLLKAVVTVESNGDHTAINPTTFDYGIAQINIKTAEAYGMDLHRLTSDRAYSLEMGAMVLSWFQKTYAHKEPETWIARYNIGTAKHLSEKQKYLAEIYIRKVRIAYSPMEL